MIAGVIAAMFTTNVRAQEVTNEEMMASAKARAEVYAKNLGLDQATADKMVETFMMGEEQVAPMRAEMKNTHAKMEEVMKEYDVKAESMLTPEQQQKMEAMKKEGKWAMGGCAHGEGKSGCTHAEAASGCSHATGAAAAGCCAGDKGKGKGKATHTEEHKH